MFSDYAYAYFIGDLLIGLPAWLLLFYFRKDIRREMLIAGILLGFTAVIWEHSFRDYWIPEGGALWRTILGDFFYGFFPGGVASAIYEGVFGKRFTRRKNRTYHWLWFAIPITALGALVFNLPLHFGVPSIYTSIAASIAITLLIVFLRKDLLLDAVLSGLLFGAITFVGFLIFIAVYPGIINAWWVLPGIQENLLFGIPVQELLFAFGVGMAVGPAYEFCVGLQFKKR